MIRTPRRSVTAASLLAAASFALAPAVAWAAPDGRIQQVETTPGSVSFVLSAKGLAEGQSIDPTSVTVRIAGAEVPTTATGASDAAQTTSRTVMLALDSSGSMAQSGKLQKAKDAATSYLAGLPDDVSVGLISFADKAEVRVSPTLDHAAVQKSIAGLKAGGATALNDAVVLTVDKLGKEGSRNAVLLSDGEDEGSKSSAEAAQKKLAESGVVLDAVSLGTGAQQKQLAAFTKAGDGTLVTATDAAGLTAAFQQAARTLGTQLAVVATVPGSVPEGTNSLDVTATAGGVQIHDSAVTVLQPAPVAAPTVAHGPIAVADPDPGFLAKSWVLIITILVLFAALLTITSIAVGAVDPQNRRAGRITRRLEGATVLGPTHEEVVVPETVLGGSVAVRKAVSFADRVAESRRTTVIATKLEEANISLRPGEWVVVHGLIAILAGLVTTLLSSFNLMAAVIAFAAGLALPWAYLERRAAGRRSKFYASLPDALQMLAGSLQAGYSLPQAVDNVARENSGPLGEEVNRALLESRLGLPLDEALEASAQRMRSQDFHWVVMALRINRRIGGNLAEVLTNVGATLRERERLRRQVKALSAEGVLSAWVLGLLPICIAAFVMITRPGYLMPLFTTPVGWAMLSVGLVLYLIGILWMRNLVNMEV